MNNIRQLDIHLLLTLQALLTEKHISKAAVKLFKSQPAVSHSLAELRKVFNDPLLIRQNGKLERTPRAEELLKPLTEILNQVKVLNQAMRVKEKDNTLILKEYNTLLKMTDVVGFVFKPKQLDEDELELYSKWLDAKAVKDFEKADQYRAELIQKGII